MTGKVVRLVPEKQFGFIRSDVGKTDYFFHRTEFDGHWDDLVADFGKEIKVEFNEANSAKGPRAENVRLI